MKKLLRFRVILPVLLLVLACQIIFVVVPEVKEEWSKRTVQITSLPPGYSLSSFEHTEKDYIYLYENGDGGYFSLTYTPDSELSLCDYLKSKDVHWTHTTLLPTSNGMAASYVYGNKGDYTFVAEWMKSLFVINSSIDSYDITQIFRTISIRV